MNKFSKKYKKKLIIFCPSIEECGVEKNLFLIANHISRKNVEVNIISFIVIEVIISIMHSSFNKVKVKVI